MRFRLTLLYSLLFLASGAALLTITYLLVDHTGNTLVISQGGKSIGAVTSGGSAASPILRLQGSGSVPPQFKSEMQSLYSQAVQQHSNDVRQLLIGSGIALGAMAVLSVLLGWLVAGRTLRPLRAMRAKADRISERNLHERLALTGPKDELTGLADTIDGLLGRLETAFASQRRFIANAAHELRTPLTLERTLLEVAMSNPRCTIDSLRQACQRAVATTEKHERLIESLLTLATSERGLDKREVADLAEAADAVLLDSNPEISHEMQRQHLHIETAIAAAPVVGDERLMERLVANLFDNAVRYNRFGGHVSITTGTSAGRAYVLVSNTGPTIAPDDVERLFQPFQRLEADAVPRSAGAGLGLSIVRAIAGAHGATIRAEPGSEGGLVVEVVFPPPVPHEADQDGGDGAASDRRRRGEPYAAVH